MSITSAPEALATAEEQVILVDENDREVGVCEKGVAHAQSRLHRAFSIFLVDRRGHVLLQRRSLGKYHSGGQWANACCGHPRPAETTLAGAVRRLREELGVTTKLEHRFVARYRAPVGPGMEENEIAHVYFGGLTTHPRPDPDEVMDIRLISYDALLDQATLDGVSLAPWLTHYIGAHRDEIAASVAKAQTVATI